MERELWKILYRLARELDRPWGELALFDGGCACGLLLGGVARPPHRVGGRSKTVA